MALHCKALPDRREPGLMRCFRIKHVPDPFSITQLFLADLSKPSPKFLWTHWPRFSKLYCPRFVKVIVINSSQLLPWIREGYQARFSLKLLPYNLESYDPRFVYLVISLDLSKLLSLIISKITLDSLQLFAYIQCIYARCNAFFTLDSLVISIYFAQLLLYIFKVISLNFSYCPTFFCEMVNLHLSV